MDRGASTPLVTTATAALVGRGACACVCSVWAGVPLGDMGSTRAPLGYGLAAKPIALLGHHPGVEPVVDAVVALAVLMALTGDVVPSSPPAPCKYAYGNMARQPLEVIRHPMYYTAWHVKLLRPPAPSIYWTAWDVNIGPLHKHCMVLTASKTGIAGHSSPMDTILLLQRQK